MTGGGFGGCVIALVEADAADSVAAAVTGAFAARGLPLPEAFSWITEAVDLAVVHDVMLRIVPLHH